MPKSQRLRFTSRNALFLTEMLQSQLITHTNWIKGGVTDKNEERNGRRETRE